ncbi:MAG: hypothetical protein U0X76_04500 [Bacteroidia bacterium]
MPGFFRKLFHEMVFRHFFISGCAVSMIFATQLLNHSTIYFSPYVFFLGGATFLIYNFHTESFYLDYSGWRAFVQSVKNRNLPLIDYFFYISAALITSVFFLMLSNSVKLFLIPLAAMTLLYSIPFWGYRKRKLRELLFVKIPLLSLIWALTTVIVPAVEQNINPWQPFVLLQFVCRFLFIFALCVPFEIRDVEIDRSKNVRTIPVVYGTMATRNTGIILLVVEMIFHHFMPAGMTVRLALDLSSAFGIIWILLQKEEMSGYFFKFLVDGTMILRFLFVYLALRLL